MVSNTYKYVVQRIDVDQVHVLPWTSLFVSTALDTWEAECPERFMRDVKINGTVYRRLDPEYYAWLRSRIHLAEIAASAGRISQEAFEELREKFNTVHKWAVAHFGDDSLREAILNLDARNYLPPAAEQDMSVRTVRVAGQSAAEADAQVVAMVDTIRDQAFSLGWTQESLYGAGGTTRNVFGVFGVFGKACSLAGLLKPTHRIGEVTRQSIEIICPDGVRLRFYNPDVEQPWIRRVKSE